MHKHTHTRRTYFILFLTPHVFPPAFYEQKDDITSHLGGVTCLGLSAGQFTDGGGTEKGIH